MKHETEANHMARHGRKRSSTVRPAEAGVRRVRRSRQRAAVRTGDDRRPDGVQAASASKASKVDKALEDFLAAPRHVGNRCSTCGDELAAEACAKFAAMKEEGDVYHSWRHFNEVVLRGFGVNIKYATLMNHVRNCLGAD